MPRRLFQRFRPIAARLREKWYFKALGPRLTDPRLWSVNRRAITSAFGAGIAIAFVPLPVHLPLGLIVAMVWRLNVPAMIGTLLLMNPLVIVPMYYVAYRVGALLLRLPPGKFVFSLDWNWLQTGLGAFWKPFLLGCLVCGVLGGYLAYRVMELIWLRSTVNRLNARKAGVRE